MKKTLRERVVEAKKNGMTLKMFIDEMGWEDWMKVFLDDPNKDEISDEENNKINDNIKEVWDDEKLTVLYDTYAQEVLECDGKPIYEDYELTKGFWISEEFKKYIEKNYLEDTEEIDNSEYRERLKECNIMEELEELLNESEFGYSNEKRYIVDTL